MARRNEASDGHSAYVSYADALEWQIDFARAYRCLVEWKLTIRREQDGTLGCYVTAFVKARLDEGRRLLGQQVVRFGKGAGAATLPGAMIQALVLLDRDLGGSLDSGITDDSTTDPAEPLY